MSTLEWLFIWLVRIVFYAIEASIFVVGALCLVGIILGIGIAFSEWRRAE
jgi:hypothetical protein